MQEQYTSRQLLAEIGKRIRDLREAKGLSRRDLADRLKVDVTSLGGWEGGKRLPREKVRLRLARLLGSDPATLFAMGAAGGSEPITARAFGTTDELHDLLIELTNHTRKTLRALRLAAPYGTSAYVQTDWRRLVSQRLLDSTLEVKRIEIFYDVRRLQEVLSNILRYDGRPYCVKGCCIGLRDVFPAFGGYFFDDDEFLLGAYWATVPPEKRPSLRASGAPFRIFFNAYWDEIWQRGVWLNSRGAHDLSDVQRVAYTLGLSPQNWSRFVEEARELEIGDGAPPLI